jgi:hypothetical protein
MQTTLKFARARGAHAFSRRDAFGEFASFARFRVVQGLTAGAESGESQRAHATYARFLATGCVDADVLHPGQRPQKANGTMRQKL